MNVSTPSVIVWFRDDLRLSDHAALIAARDTGAVLTCLYILDDTETGKHSHRPLGAAAKWWLANSLRTLEADLKKLGQNLVLRQGDARAILPQLTRDADAKAVFWIDNEVPAEAARARDVTAALHKIGVETHASPRALLAPPRSIRTKEGNGLRVFTPFWKRVRAQGEPPRPLPTVKKLPPPLTSLKSESLKDWKFVLLFFFCV